MTRERVLLLLAPSLLAVTSTAQRPPEPRVVDLKASDGAILKATFFTAGKPAPGVILLHQCNRQRKSMKVLDSGKWLVRE